MTDAFLLRSARVGEMVGPDGDELDSSSNMKVTRRVARRGSAK